MVLWNAPAGAGGLEAFVLGRAVAALNGGRAKRAVFGCSSTNASAPEFERAGFERVAHDIDDIVLAQTVQAFNGFKRAPPRPFR